MKLNLIALALAATAFGAIAAHADEVVIKERAPGVVVKEQLGTPNVVVRERATVGYRDRHDCATKSVTRTNGVTDNTTTKTVKRCD